LEPEQSTPRATRQPVTGHTRDFVIFADRAIWQLATHWLFLANLFWGLYVGLPFLAPILMNAGLETPAKAIYLLYRPACHQRPERSYFLNGPQAVYSIEELDAAGVNVGAFSRDIGNEQVGWKVAFCQRDVAIYGTMFVAGLAYGLVRHRLRGWKMRFRYFLLWLVPMGLDGVIQLVTPYESTWLARTITGAIFGLGAVMFAYPYLEESFTDMRHILDRKLAPRTPPGNAT
jgi:uncharacterized membrane protein